MGMVLDELWERVEITRCACHDEADTATDTAWMALGEFELALDRFEKALDKGDDS